MSSRQANAWRLSGAIVGIFVGGALGCSGAPDGPDTNPANLNSVLVVFSEPIADDSLTTRAVRLIDLLEQRQRLGRSPVPQPAAG